MGFPAVPLVCCPDVGRIVLKLWALPPTCHRPWESQGRAGLSTRGARTGGRQGGDKDNPKHPVGNGESPRDRKFPSPLGCSGSLKIIL